MVRLQNSQTTSLRSKTRDENSTLVPGRDRGFISAGIYSPDGGESSATTGRGWWRRAVQAGRFAGPAGVQRPHLAEPLHYRPRRVV